jgi:hypothetical protein
MFYPVGDDMKPRVIAIGRVFSYPEIQISDFSSQIQTQFSSFKLSVNEWLNYDLRDASENKLRQLPQVVLTTSDGWQQLILVDRRAWLYLPMVASGKTLGVGMGDQKKYLDQSYARENACLKNTSVE